MAKAKKEKEEGIKIVIRKIKNAFEFIIFDQFGQLYLILVALLLLCVFLGILIGLKIEA